MRVGELLTRPLYRIYEDRLLRSLDPVRLPRHVGIIHDGHRRFAREAGLPDYASSYRAGMDKFIDFLGWCREVDVPAITCWLLSKENLARPTRELGPYFEVLIELFERLPAVAEKHDLRIGVIGSLDLLPAPLVAAAKALEEGREGERRLTIGLAYAGRQEIVDACRDLVENLLESGVDPSELPQHIDAEALAAHLYTPDLPDPDLVIRTSGESRLSGFLLWQAAYAEYSFVDVYWPAFRRVDFLRALRDFSRRERRFGK
ncbi:MAG: polyprenyl diphosphate synthase [Acidimicrobiia bacterium]